MLALEDRWDYSHIGRFPWVTRGCDAEACQSNT
jgi:hypothetical protein